MYGPFFLERDISLFPPASIATPHNKAVSPLILARLVAQRRLAPWCLWLTTNWRTTFAATMSVVARVHHRASHGRATPHMTRTPGLADVAVLMIHVAHLSDGSHTENMHLALLTRRQSHQCIIALFCHQLGAYTRAAHHLTTVPSLQLNVMDRRTGWNIL